MKFGVRKPNISKRIKARTTGKLKRKVKKIANPLYGKEGMGYINNPKRAIKNKVYNKTTVSSEKFIKRTGNIFIDLFIMFPIACIYYTFLLFYYICVKLPIWIYNKIAKKGEDI